MVNNDNAFDALAAARRRELLIGLLECDLCHVSELSDDDREVGEANPEFLREHLSTDGEIADVDEDLLRLYNVHLPKLAEYRFVEWNRDDCTVAPGPRFDELVPVLELLDDRTDDRPAAEIIVATER